MAAWDLSLMKSNTFRTDVVEEPLSFNTVCRFENAFLHCSSRSCGSLPSLSTPTAPEVKTNWELAQVTNAGDSRLEAVGDLICSQVIFLAIVC